MKVSSKNKTNNSQQPLDKDTSQSEKNDSVGSPVTIIDTTRKAVDDIKAKEKEYYDPILDLQ